jgi:hypothetical protein
MQVVTATEQSPSEGENHPTTKEVPTFSGTPNFFTMVTNNS